MARFSAARYAILTVFLLNGAFTGYEQSVSVDSQDKGHPQFDIVSVHETAPAPEYSQRLVNDSHSGQFIATSFRLSQLVAQAFGVNFQFQILDLPKDLASKRFDINAKSDEATDRMLRNASDDESARLKEHMLRSLLVDRFHLRYHLESRPLPAYEMTSLPKGPKFRPHDPKDNEYRGFRTERTDQGIEVDGKNITMDALPTVLAFYLRSTVVDKTGLKGTYDLTLKFKNTLTGTESATDGEWPALETAVQEQLGLKLVPTKVPTEVVIIEHIEMPTPN